MCDKKLFLKIVKDHGLTILHDDGLYRHIRLSKPGTNAESFSLVTWPGYLCFCGDMGDYTFSRLDDMFKFFRSEELEINPSYWAEKCEAMDRDGVKEFSPGKFVEALRQEMEDGEFSDDAKRVVELGLIPYGEDGEEIALMEVARFNYEGYDFPDFYEHDLREFTWRFLFCCYAIVWGIGKYDKSREKV